MKLHILRHAESVGNATGEYGTEVSDGLSARGHEQAGLLAQQLRAHAFDQVVVSPLKRTRETIAPYLDATDQQAEIWPEIAEACWHDETEQASASWRTQPDQLPGEVAHLFTYRHGQAVRPAHPESFGEGLRRVHDTQALLQERAGAARNTLLMVTHGHFARELIKLALDVRSAAEIHHDNCGMTLLSFDGVWSMEYANRPCVG